MENRTGETYKVPLSDLDRLIHSCDELHRRRPDVMELTQANPRVTIHGPGGYIEVNLVYGIPTVVYATNTQPTPTWAPHPPQAPFQGTPAYNGGIYDAEPIYFTEPSMDFFDQPNKEEPPEEKPLVLPKGDINGVTE